MGGIRTDVVIIGGGPAGLAAAIAARRKGLSVTVADGMRPPIDKACGEGLMPDSLRVLGQLGVPVSEALGHPFRGIRFLHGDVNVESSFPTGAGIGVRRKVMHQLLVTCAEDAGVRLLWGTPITVVDGKPMAVGGESVRARWIVGADGAASRVRIWARLDDHDRQSIRYGFRRHYRVAPWTDCMEVYWGTGCQMYVTPVGSQEVCIALISRDPHLRLDAALPRFPFLLDRLGGAPPTSAERSAVSASRRLRSVVRGNVALIGDASGSVDAITGEGLCLAFHQALCLAEALGREDLSSYASAHQRLMRRPAFMADFLLLIDRFPALRARALLTLAAKPHLFSRLLAMHVGALAPPRFAATAIALGWSVLSA